MTSEGASDSRVRAWFDAAASASPQERARILTEARRVDPEAADELESLLVHLDRTAMIDSPPAGLVDLMESGLADGVEPAPQRVGPFQIIRELGRGGMGVVYEAQQDFPTRRVALKLLRPELVRTALLRRFVREARTLARLQHEGIAQLYEAGYADAERRRPYIAMELIEGRVVSQYVASTTPGTRAVLGLVAQVADAVDHAHRRGVIHRDLKPGNIMVTPDGRPKVLDFGVSRLTTPDEVDYTATAAGHLIGTLGYMSPEQFGDDPSQVDERSDVYALGVILYELLAGHPPLDLSRVSLTHAATMLRDQEPAPLGRISREFQGDIEAIVGKALEKSVADRYRSAADLASDIRRYLANEPVLARPQTTWYQARKFAARNRGLVWGVGAAMLALIVGTAATAWQAVLATRHRDLAQQQELRATESANLMRRIIQAAAPENAQGTEPTVRQMLLSAETELAGNTSVHPLVAGDTHRLLTSTFAALGDYQRAETHARAAMDLHTQALGAEHRTTLGDANELSRALTRLGKAEQAIEVGEKALAVGARLYPKEPSTIRSASVLSLAYSERMPPDRDRAFKMQKDAYEWSLATLGPDSLLTLLAEGDMGLTYVAMNQPEEGIRLLRTALEKRRRLQGEDHPDTLLALSNLAFALDGTGDPAEELTLHRQMVEKGRRVLGPDHPRTLEFEFNFILSLFRNKDLPAALAQARLTAAAAEKKMGPIHKDVLKIRGLRTSMLIESKLFDEAEAEARRHYDDAVKAFGAEDDRSKQVVTLFFDLAQARGSLAGMRDAAARLRGTPYEEELLRQLKVAEDEAAQSAQPH